VSGVLSVCSFHRCCLSLFFSLRLEFPAFDEYASVLDGCACGHTWRRRRLVLTSPKNSRQFSAFCLLSFSRPSLCGAALLHEFPACRLECASACCSSRTACKRSPSRRRARIVARSAAASPRPHTGSPAQFSLSFCHKSMQRGVCVCVRESTFI